MHKFLITISLLSLLLAAAPAFADEQEDYILNEVNEWEQIAEDRGFEVLIGIAEMIEQDPVIFNIVLGPGSYKIYGSGGMDINNLNTAIYDEDGDRLDDDRKQDKIPILEFSVEERQTLQLEVSVYHPEGEYVEDFFCIVIASTEEGGELHEWDLFELEDMDDELLLVSEDLLVRMEEEAEESGMAVVVSDILYIENDFIDFEITLEPGFYTLSGEPDERVTDLDVAIYDINNEYIEITSDTTPEAFVICDFYIDEETELMIEFEIFAYIRGASTTWITYVLAEGSEPDDEDKRAYIEEKLISESIIYEEQGAEIFESGFKALLEGGESDSVEYSLGAGHYLAASLGGRMIDDLELTILAGDEVLTYDNAYDDNAFCRFDLEEWTTITLETFVYEYVGEPDLAYYAWIIAEDLLWEDMPEIDDPDVPANEDQLMSYVEMLGDMLIDDAEVDGEYVVYTVVKSLDGTGESNGWIYEDNLARGTYYFYAFGDDECLLDLDIVIYDEQDRVVASNEFNDNEPWCELIVPDEGGNYEAVFYAYSMNCDVGYLWFGLTKE